ncbi:MAG: hypothetical protein C0444_11350 [Microbacterium sp.]|nr:hypothetical protein [Microbacterium sp.]MBA4346086.1 hypothetical protein [Microbacterium sp.]
MKRRRFPVLSFGGGLVAAVTVATLVLAGSATQSTDSASAISLQDTIGVGVEPVSIAILPDGSRAYVANKADDTVSVIDLATQTTTTIAVGDSPQGVSVRPGGSQVWVANRGSSTVSIISTTTDTVIATVAVDTGPWAIAFDLAARTAYVSHFFDNTIVPISMTTLTRSTSLPNGDSAQGIAVETATGDIWTTLTGTDQVAIIDPATPGSPTLVTVGDYPVRVVFSLDGQSAFVANEGASSSSVSVISTATRTVTDEIVLDGGYVSGLSLSPDGVYLFATEQRTDVTSSKLWVIDIATRTKIHAVGAGQAVDSTAVSTDGNFVYATDSDVNTVLKIGLEVDRLSGANRFATAVEISQQGFPAGSGALYIASGADFPDALAAGPAAAYRNSPLLLVSPTSIPAEVSAEIARLNPGTIYIVGGTSVVSSEVESQLAATGAIVVRLAGADRYDTGRRIVADVYGLVNPSDSTGVAVVYIATGRGFADALSAGPAAARVNGAVILVDGLSNSVPAATLALLDQLNPLEIKIAGGSGVVSTAIQTQLAGLYSVERIAGSDRYTTSAAINADAFDTASTVLWATGAGFPDALAGVGLAGQVDGPIMLVRPTCAPAAAKSELWRLDTDRLFLLGGTGALSAAVESRVSC